MTRPPVTEFQHIVDLYPIATGRGADGAVPGTPLLGRAAIVDEKVKLVEDQRDGAEPGTQVNTTAHVFLLLEDYVKPGSDVVLRPGSPVERRAQVVASAYYDHPSGPEHVELWVA